jgi:small subunit ribosomal protein S17
MAEDERNRSEEASAEGSAAPEEESSAPEEAQAPEPEEAAAPQEAAEEAAPAEPEEAPEAEAAPEPPPPTHPRQVRKQARSRHSGAALPARAPEERAAERAKRRQERAASRRAWRRKGRERDAAARGDAEEAPPALRREHGPGRPRVRQGVVVSDKADKTITVRIDVTRQHRTYQKIVRSTSMLHAHDERNEAHAGDTVRVVESRPLSRTKRWRLVDVLERAR